MDNYIVEANKLLLDNLIPNDLNCQEKVAALEALAEKHPEILTQIGLKVAAPPSNIHCVCMGKAKTT